jgi:hypothetical protein
MPPIALMRLCGWTLLTVGTLFVALGVIALVISLQEGSFPGASLVFFLIGIIGVGTGARWAFHVPTDTELAKWRRR